MFNKWWFWILNCIGKWYTRHQLNMFQKWKNQANDTLAIGKYHPDDQSLIRDIHRSCDLALSKLQEIQFLTNKIQQDVDDWKPYTENEEELC